MNANFYGVLRLLQKVYMLKRNPIIESTNSPIATLRPLSLYGTQSQGGQCAVKRRTSIVTQRPMTALHSALCRSALSSAFNKIPSVEPQTARRAVAMSVQQFSSYEERQHKIPSRLITSKRVKIMHKCTVHDTDVHITFRYIFVRNFFVPPVTNLESYISTVLTKVTFQLCSQKPAYIL